jgi:hypothetical protein
MADMMEHHPPLLLWQVHATLALLLLLSLEFWSSWWRRIMVSAGYVGLVAKW